MKRLPICRRKQTHLSALVVKMKKFTDFEILTQLPNCMYILYSISILLMKRKMKKTLSMK